MSWAIGYDEHWDRDVGYGVVAFCDHPDCNAVIDRGLGYVCGGEPYGGDCGCGLFFCGEHQVGTRQRCERCNADEMAPFPAKPDHPDWIRHKLTHPSWAQWRKENPKKVAKLKSAPSPENLT